MRRIVIVVEGQTEQEFVKQCMAPYLFSKYGITSVSARLIGKPGHKGGDVRYDRLKKDLIVLLREADVVVSMFIDYFKLASDFPSTETCQKIPDSARRISCIEQGIMDDINAPLFIPYIQKHEFEALLFCSDTGFQKYFSAQSCTELVSVIQQFNNPEDVNNSQPPSYRLLDIIGRHEQFRYNKVLHGNILALEVGMNEMLKKCQRFAGWIEKISLVALQN